MDSVTEIINLKLRHENVNIHRKELEELGSSDWFLKNIIKYPSDKKDSNNNTIYEIWEDKKTVMSIFDSLRFNSLIIYPDVSLDYLIILCDKWCVPQELIENIIVRKKELNKPKEKSYEFKSAITLKCINCYAGFKFNENNSDSCKFHPLGCSDNRRLCCQRPKDDPYCTVGYHVPFKTLNEIEEFNKLIKKIEE